MFLLETAVCAVCLWLQSKEDSYWKAIWSQPRIIPCVVVRDSVNTLFPYQKQGLSHLRKAK